MEFYNCYSIISDLILHVRTCLQDLAAYVLTIEIQSPLDLILLRSPVMLDIVDSGERRISLFVIQSFWYFMNFCSEAFILWHLPTYLTTSDPLSSFSHQPPPVPVLPYLSSPNPSPNSSCNTSPRTQSLFTISYMKHEILNQIKLNIWWHITSNII